MARPKHIWWSKSLFQCKHFSWVNNTEKYFFVGSNIFQFKFAWINEGEKSYFRKIIFVLWIIYLLSISLYFNLYVYRICSLHIYWKIKIIFFLLSKETNKIRVERKRKIKIYSVSRYFHWKSFKIPHSNFHVVVYFNIFV